MAVPNGENVEGVRISESTRSVCDGVRNGADIAGSWNPSFHQVAEIERHTNT